MAPPDSLFGTDGVRGPAGVGLLAAEQLARLGAAVAASWSGQSLTAKTWNAKTWTGKRRTALVARDTRASGPSVCAAVTAGLSAGGIAVTDAGVLPTPGAALLVRAMGFGLGVVVSASHNPWRDNGVKLLGADGGKLDDAREAAITAAFRAEGPIETGGAAPGAVSALAGAAESYESLLLREFRGLSLRGLRIAVDAAHGAQSGLASRALRRLGAKVTALHESPDGRNINERCGALHPQRLARAVRAGRCHAGIAFDGDADRVQLVDERGRVMDGDAILAALAPRLRAAGRLPGGVVVGTSMTNGALETLLAAGGMSLVRTAVGDRHIVAEMRARGHGLGGEPSGHVILPVRESGARGAPLLTGDGLRAALAFLRCMKDEGLAASAVPGGYRAWPQEIRSLVTEGRPPLASLARTSAAISAAEASLGASGRVVVRWSGTEPKLRIMVEAGTPAALRAAMDPIVAAVREEAGGR